MHNYLIKHFEKRDSVVFKIIFNILFPLFTLIFLIIVFFSILYFQNARSTSEKQLQYLSGDISRQLEAIYHEGFVLSQSMALAQQSELFGHRDATIKYARQLLDNHPLFTAAYFAYESDADGKDRWSLKQKKDTLLQHAITSTGRFVPYWYRHKVKSDSIILTPLNYLEKRLYYNGVRNMFHKTGRAESILSEPYKYGGKLITEQTYPIIIDNKFVGISGVDRSLSEFNEYLRQIKEREGVNIYVISSDGLFVANTRNGGDALLAVPVEKTAYARTFKSFIYTIDNQNVAVFEDPFSDYRSYYISMLIKDPGWRLIISRPIKDINGPVWKNVLLLSSVVGVIAFIVILLILGVLKVIMRNETEMREVTERNKAILSASPSGIITIDIKGIIESFNPAAEQMFGYTEEEVLGKNVKMLMPDPNSANHDSYLENYRTTGIKRVMGRRRLDEIAQRKNGYLFPAEIGLSEVLVEGKVRFFTAVMSDISDRKDAERRILESRRQLQEILDTSPIGIAISVNKRLQFVNPRFREIFDLNVGANAEALYQSNGERERILERMKRDGKIENEEITYFDIHGNELIMLTTYYPIRYLGEDGILAWTVDVSAIKQAQKLAEINQERFRFSLETMGAFYWVHDIPNHTLEFDSVKFFEQYGYSAEEISKEERFVFGLMHPDDVEKIWTSIDEHINDESKQYKVEIRYVKKDGGIAWTLNIGRINERTPDGRVKTIVGITIDITERKAAEQKLEEYNQRLKIATQAGNIGIWEFNVDMQTSIWDERVTMMYGFRSNVENPVERWRAMVNKDDLAAMDAELKDLMENKKQLLNQIIHLTLETGERRIFNIMGNLVRSKAIKGTKVIGVTMDITEQMAIQQNLELLNRNLLVAKDEAESATQAKSEFLARMSHEIRTPLNAIIGLSHLTLKTVLSKKQEDYVQKVYNSGKVLLGIINDILDFSKIEAGKLELDKIPFNLEKVFQDLANIVTYKAHEKELELVFGIGSDVPLSLVGDPLRLSQILINLVNNAIKFTSEGEILVRANVRKEEKSDIVLSFVISDTGIGIPKEKLGRLFKSFSQVDVTTTRQYGGTGLGLAISQRLAQLMGGDICVDSQEGKGSQFYVDIRFEKASVQQRDLLLPSVDLRGLHVLVCDDNESSRIILKEILESFTFKVDLVKSGNEAIQKLEKSKNNPYELILMDWKMPEMNGLETIRKIKEDKKITSVPIIIMVTAYGHEEIYQEVEDLNINGLVLKPLNYSVIFNTIMDAIGRKDLIRTPDVAEAEFTEEQMKQIRGAHVLLVEDNDMNQQVASELIESVGCVVHVAENGEQALTILSENPKEYELIFMDLQMPVMDGYTATELIQKNKKLVGIPIIAMTADAVSGVRDRCLSLGMTDFVSKPIDPNSIVKTLLKYIPFRKRKIVRSKILVPKDNIVPEDFSIFKSLDVRDGLKRINGNVAVYKKLILKFASGYHSFVKEVTEAHQAGNHELVHRLIHTLKGVSGNIGATLLYEGIKKYELILYAEDHNFYNYMDELEALLNPVIKETSDFAKKEKIKEKLRKDSSPRDKISEKELRERLKELRRMVNDSDMDALAICSSLLNSSLPNELELELSRLQNLLTRYDFQSALDVLAKILNKADS